MSKFNDAANMLRESLKGMITADNVEAIASLNNQIDILEAEHKEAQKETQEAKDTLVKYVKEYAFNEKANQDTGTEEALTLDEAFAKAFSNIK